MNLHDLCARKPVATMWVPATPGQSWVELSGDLRIPFVNGTAAIPAGSTILGVTIDAVALWSGELGVAGGASVGGRW